MGKTCFFIGHRDTPSAVMPALEQAIEQHIAQYGVTEFIVGGYGNFDSMAARAVIKAKQAHPSVILTRLLAYHPSERPVRLREGFDGSWYPSGMERVPRRTAIVSANFEAVLRADCLIYYLSHPGSNTRNIVGLAKSQERRGRITLTALGNPIE